MPATLAPSASRTRRRSREEKARLAAALLAEGLPREKVCQKLRLSVGRFQELMHQPALPGMAPAPKAGSDELADFADGAEIEATVASRAGRLPSWWCSDLHAPPRATRMVSIPTGYAQSPHGAACPLLPLWDAGSGGFSPAMCDADLWLRTEGKDVRGIVARVDGAAVILTLPDGVERRFDGRRERKALKVRSVKQAAFDRKLNPKMEVAGDA